MNPSSIVHLFFLCLCASVACFAQYDLVLKGGHVIDPKNNVDAVRDVAIRGGRIAAVAPNLSGGKTVDVSDLYVTPGLVDIHVHVFTGLGQATLAGGDTSVHPDHTCLRAGVTTVVDVGTSGWRTFPEFRRTIIDRVQTRVLAMLNIIGMGMPNYDVEQNPTDMD